MKRLFGAALALLAGLAAAQTTTPTADSWEMRQRNEANNGVYVYYIVPDGAVDQIPIYNGSTNKPEYLKLGTGLSRSGTTLNVGLSAAQISGTTSTGQSLLTASDAAAARAAIGAGTSSFSGAYADLTGKPVLFDGQYSSLTGIPSTFTPAAHTQAWSTITSTPTSLSGYGITDAYPLAGNPSGFVTQAGARGAISLTTTGSGAATYNSSTGVLNIPTPSAGSGTVTSITAGTGLSGGTITTSGTISLPNTGTAGTYSGVTTDAQGRVTAGTTMSINDAPGRALVSATNATGFQVSASRNAYVCYEGQINTTSTIGGPSSGSIFIETAATNSTTPGDWTKIAEQTASNTITLAVVLQQVDGEPWSLCRMVGAGKYVRVRSQTNGGTVSFSINATQQEVLL